MVQEKEEELIVEEEDAKPQEERVKENKLKKFEGIILLAFILIAICLLGYGLYLLKQDGAECVANPIEYYNSHSNDICTCASDISRLINEGNT